MRPGRVDDLPAMLDLLRADVGEGRRDATPPESVVRRLAEMDWGARARVIDRLGGGLEGAITVTVRATPAGPLAFMLASTSTQGTQLLAELLDWGLRYARAIGASDAQLYSAKGQGEGLPDLGLRVVRPWWRMDRILAGGLPEPAAVPGYELQDAGRYRSSGWSDLYNQSFADHWRFFPYSEEELMTGRQAELCLVAVTRDGAPAALAISEVQTYAGDPRPQPVGLIVAVGTLPDHRRRGLAAWLVAESLRRMSTAGARHASLYVDGQSGTRAFEIYGKLGFGVAFEYEVWEASLR